MKGLTISVAIIATLAAGCKAADRAAAETSQPHSSGDSASAQSADSVPTYTGTNSRGIPNYARRPFTAEERSILRSVYGIEDPTHLYISDSTDDGLLKYDTKLKECRTCYVNSYRIGFISIRRQGESWNQLEKRVRATPLSSFPPEARVATTSLDALDPDIRSDVEQMLAEARSQGFVLRIAATYRSPEREAYLMAKGGSTTHTLTSLHSYGRARPDDRRWKSFAAGDTRAVDCVPSVGHPLRQKAIQDSRHS